MAIIEGISAVSTALGIAKTLRDIDKNYDAVTYKAQMADLVGALTDAKLALADAKEQIAEQAKEISGLKASFEAKCSVVKGHGDYHYISDDQGNPLGYPICPKCEITGMIVQLKEWERSGNGQCPHCSKIFNPVVCYLPYGNAHLTKQDKESYEWDSATNANNSRNQFV